MRTPVSDTCQTRCQSRLWHRLLLASVISLLLGLLAGCGGGGGDTPKEVVLVTHDSFAVSKPVRRAFERETGLTLKILKGGDAGEALNRALLTAGNPQGDVFFGIDNNLLSRALTEDLFDAYESPELARVEPGYDLDQQHRVTPIDHGDVCLNVDRGWFAKRGLEPPRGFDDLLAPRYRGLLVVENPATSTRGSRSCSRRSPATARRLAELVATAPRQRRSRRRRLGGGLHRAFQRRVREQG